MKTMAVTVETKTVTLQIDGQEVTVPEGTTIWSAAQEAGVDIPVLCHDERYDPAGDPKHTTTADNELFALADRYGVEKQNGLPCGDGRPVDLSNPVIAINHDACIMCDRCVRACDDIQGNDVIGRTGKGHTARIAFDLDDPMGQSSCVTCGECVAACPTGAITNKPITAPIRPRSELTQVDTV